MSQWGYDSSGTTEATTRQLEEALEHLNRNFKEKLMIGIGRPTVSASYQAKWEAAKQAQQAKQRRALERKRFDALRAKDDRIENPVPKPNYEHIWEKYHKIAGEQILATPRSERTLDRIHLIRDNASALAKNEIYILQARADEDAERRRLRAQAAEEARAALTRDVEKAVLGAHSVKAGSFIDGGPTIQPSPFTQSIKQSIIGQHVQNLANKIDHDLTIHVKGTHGTQRLDFSLDFTKLNQKEDDMITGEHNLITPSGRHTVVTQYTEEAHPRRRKGDPAKKLSRVETLEALLAIVQDEAEQWRTKEADKVHQLSLGEVRQRIEDTYTPHIGHYGLFESDLGHTNALVLGVANLEFNIELRDREIKPTEAALTLHAMAEKSLKELIRYAKKVSK